jgi:hypothetical protein
MSSTSEHRIADSDHTGPPDPPEETAPEPRSQREASPPPDESVEPTTPSTPTDVPVRGFLPVAPNRLGFESVFVRLIATAGVVGAGTALGAILTAAAVAGWIVGFAVALLSVALAAVLWRSRRL